MKKMFSRLLLMCCSAMLATAALAAEPAETKPDHPQPAVEPFAEFVTPSDSLPKLRYFADDKITLNDRCPVRRVRLNPKMGASYVNNQPVGFC